MSDTLNAREEQQLLEVVKRATDLVEAGSSPNAAVEKVARDNGFGPGKIRLIGQAYNTGQQLGQWRRPRSTSILDKLASFELCDPEEVIRSIYHKEPEKVAIDAAYSRKPVFAETVAAAREKTASYRLSGAKEVPAATPRVEVALSNIQRVKQAQAEAQRQASAAKDAVMSKIASLVTYFRGCAYSRLPFPTVKAAAITYMGDEAKSLMDLVEQRLPIKEKTASAYTAVDVKAAPFTLIREAINHARTAFDLTKKAQDLRNELETVREEQLRPFSGAARVAAEKTAKDTASIIFGVGEKRAFGIVPEIGAIAAGDILAHKATHDEAKGDPYGDVTSLDDELEAIRKQSQQAIGMRRKPRQEKVAFLGAGIGTAIGSSMGKTLGTAKSRSDLVDDAWMGLEDPEHENELRKIKAHAMINQMLTDPNDPISSHDPDKVLTAYNEISQAAPRVAENAATLRPALRKRLEGHTEPFEAKELLDIEHGLAKTKMPTPNTNILSSSTESLLG